MATRLEIQTDVLALLGTDPQASAAEVNVLIQLRYSHLYETWHWSRRSRDFVMATVAQVVSDDDDTVTATLGSAVINSAGTPFTSAMTGSYIDIGDLRQHYVVVFVSSSQITLQDGEGAAVTWPLATASGLSWRIFKHRYVLPVTAEALLSLAGDCEIEEFDGGREAMDRMDPDRSTTGDHPKYWFYDGEVSGVRAIELWPIPSTVRALRGKFLRVAPTLVDGTETGLNRALMVYAVAGDVYNMLFSKTGDPQYSQLALFYERKHDEVARDLKPIDLERTSPPTTLRRTRRGLGADYYVSHLDEAP
jgi:hypothetical protein